VLLLAVGLSILAVLLKLSQVERIEEVFLGLHWLPLAGALIATVLNVLFIALRWGTIANKLAGRRVARWSEYFYYFTVGRALGFVIPKDLSDVGGRTVSLNQLHGMRLAPAASSVVLDRLSDVLGTGVFLVASIPYWAGWVDERAGLVCMAGVVSLVGLFFLLGRGTVKLAALSRMANMVLTRLQYRRRAAGRALFSLPEKDVPVAELRPIFLLSAAKFISTAARMALFASALGLSISPALIFLGTPLGQLSYLVAFTPGGLGIFELGWFGILKWGGVASADSVLFVFGQRVWTVIMIGVVAVFSQLYYTASHRQRIEIDGSGRK
jgi:uncharacterized protein (TIRG00374 family)